jgi:hypothetical protein
MSSQNSLHSGKNAEEVAGKDLNDSVIMATGNGVEPEASEKSKFDKRLDEEDVSPTSSGYFELQESHTPPNIVYVAKCISREGYAFSQLVNSEPFNDIKTSTPKSERKHLPAIEIVTMVYGEV